MCYNEITKGENSNIPLGTTHNRAARSAALSPNTKLRRFPPEKCTGTSTQGNGLVKGFHAGRSAGGVAASFFHTHGGQQAAPRRSPRPAPQGKREVLVCTSPICVSLLCRRAVQCTCMAWEQKSKIVPLFVGSGIAGVQGSVPIMAISGIRS